MRILLKSTILTVVFEIIALAGVQIVAHNWLLSLSMKEKDLLEHQQELRWERNDLNAEISSLLIPDRLETIAGEIGLIPIPLEQQTVVELPEYSHIDGDLNAVSEK